MLKRTIGCLIAFMFMFSTSSALAGIMTVDIVEVDNDVVVTWDGTFDVTGLTFDNNISADNSNIDPAAVYLRAVYSGDDVYLAGSSFQPLGPGSLQEADARTGDSFGFFDTGVARVYVPDGFTSGVLSGSMTFLSSSLASLGLNEQTYSVAMTDNTVNVNVYALYNVTPNAGANGSMTPNTVQSVEGGQTTDFTITPDSGYGIDNVDGCDGTLVGSTYTTGAITGDCTVTATFDIDTDGDGVVDTADNCPAVANADQLDTDGDLDGDACDTDDDDDGVLDVDEPALGTDPLLADTDADTIDDGADACPLDPNNDIDSDGVCGNVDNCPVVANAGQLDTDGDTEGDACDTDDDNDNLLDVTELAIGTNPLLVDTDSDALNDDVDPCPLDPDNDIDEDGVCGNVDNCPVDANADQDNAGGLPLGDACDMSDSDGDYYPDLQEYQLGNARDDISDAPPLAVVAGTSTMSSTDQIDVSLAIDISPLEGAIYLEQIIDANRNGTYDAGEPVVRAFYLIDGESSPYPRLEQSDEDATADGGIDTNLNLYNNLDFHHNDGEYLFRVTEGRRYVEDTLTIQPVVSGMTISGQVTDGTDPMAGVVVYVHNEGGFDAGFGTITDASGNYVLNVPAAGSYRVNVVDMTGAYLADESAWDQLVTVADSEAVTGVDRTLTLATESVTGTVKNSLGEGIPGIMVTAGCEAANVFSVTLTESDGSYTLGSSGNDCWVSVEEDLALGVSPSNKGYIPQEDGKMATLTCNVVDFVLDDITHYVSGTVSGTLVKGVPVVANDNNGYYDPAVYTLTDAAGNYVLGLTESNDWQISASEWDLRGIDKLTSNIFGYDTNTSPTTGQNITVADVNAWIEGTVTDIDGDPVVDIEVAGWSADILSRAVTDETGFYRMPVLSGAPWTVDAFTEDEHGYGDVVEQGPFTLAADETLSGIDFVASFVDAVEAPPSISVPEINDGYFKVSWEQSPTPGVTYVLAQNGNVIYTGAANYKFVSLGSPGCTSYEVQAIKDGYVDSETSGLVTSTFLVQLPAPAAPAVPATNSNGSYKVSWSSSAVSGVDYVLLEDGKEVYRGKALYSFRNVGNGTHNYQVKVAKAGFADSSLSATSSCVVDIPLEPLDAINAPTVPAASSTGNYKVTWQTSSEPGVTYVLYENGGEVYRGKANYAFRYVGSGTYDYEVRVSKSGFSDSPLSATSSCTVGQVLTAPSIGIRTMGGGTLKLSFGSSSVSNVIYEVQENKNSAGWVTVYTGTSGYKFLYGRGSGSYIYQVRATKPPALSSSYTVSSPLVIP